MDWLWGVASFRPRRGVVEGESSYVGSINSQEPAPLQALLELDVIDASERAAAWRVGAQTFFPGLSVRDLRQRPALGSIAGSQFGPGHLWTILSPPVQVTYDPSAVSFEKT